MSDNAQGPPAFDVLSVVRAARKRKRQLTILMVAYAVFLGFVSALLMEEDRSANFVLVFPGLFLTLAWCITDARQRGESLGMPMRVALVLLFFVAFPVYIFSTRKPWAAIKFFIACFAFLVLLSTFLLAAFYVTFGIRWLMGHRGAGLL